MGVETGGEWEEADDSKGKAWSRPAYFDTTNPSAHAPGELPPADFWFVDIETDFLGVDVRAEIEANREDWLIEWTDIISR